MSFAINTKVEIYSKSLRQWTAGRVRKTYIDDDGEWLIVQLKGHSGNKNEWGKIKSSSSRVRLRRQRVSIPKVFEVSSEIKAFFHALDKKEKERESAEEHRDKKRKDRLFAEQNAEREKMEKQEKAESKKKKKKGAPATKHRVTQNENGTMNNNLLLELREKEREIAALKAQLETDRVNTSNDRKRMEKEMKMDWMLSKQENERLLAKLDEKESELMRMKSVMKAEQNEMMRMSDEDNTLQSNLRERHREIDELKAENENIKRREKEAETESHRMMARLDQNLSELMRMKGVNKAGDANKESTLKAVDKIKEKEPKQLQNLETKKKLRA